MCVYPTFLQKIIGRKSMFICALKSIHQSQNITVYNNNGDSTSALLSQPISVTGALVIQGRKNGCKYGLLSSKNFAAFIAVLRLLVSSLQMWNVAAGIRKISAWLSNSITSSSRKPERPNSAVSKLADVRRMKSLYARIETVTASCSSTIDCTLSSLITGRSRHWKMWYISTSVLMTSPRSFGRQISGGKAEPIWLDIGWAPVHRSTDMVSADVKVESNRRSMSGDW